MDSADVEEMYRTRIWARKGVERVLQEAIEDYVGGFVKLAQLGVLSESLDLYPRYIQAKRSW